MDIFKRKYEGSVPMQTGKYFVAADVLNDERKSIGGGLVADFEKYPDAVKCASEIHGLDPNHEPEIWRWTQNHGDCILVERMTTSTSEQVQEVFEIEEEYNEKTFAPAQYLVF